MENNELSVEKMKEMANSIIKEELEKDGIEVNFLPVTNKEYCNYLISNSNSNFLSKLLTLIYAGGYNDKKGNIIVFLDYVAKLKNIDDKIFRLANVCYHEARHSKQLVIDDYSYDKFLRNVDENKKVKDYLLNHDKFSFEIGANLYGVRKAKEYLKNNNPELYEKAKDKIEKREKRYMYDYMTYDASHSIERVIDLFKIRDLFSCGRKLEDISPVFEIFLNKDASFKKINEIVENEKFKTLDKRIVYAFFSSRQFLEQIDIEKLSIEELELVNESLKYTNDLYEMQIELINEHYNNIRKEFIDKFDSTDSLLLKNLIYIAHCFKTCMDVTARSVHGVPSMFVHKESIPKYLEESNNILVKKKIDKYLTINEQDYSDY